MGEIIRGLNFTTCFLFPPFVPWLLLSQVYLLLVILLLRGFTLICNANSISLPLWILIELKPRLCHLHGIGGLTVPRLARELWILIAHHPPPKVIILEIGTNDLSSQSPEVVIRELLDLVDFLQSVDSSTAVGVCKVLPRRHRSTGLPQEDFNNRAATFNKMLEALFDDRQFVFVWGHFEMQSLSRRVLLPDGVHLNRHGQYCLYRSYRGAILKGVSFLSNRAST